jgi:DNA-binding CsgD family transcriptional regulator
VPHNHWSTHQTRTVRQIKQLCCLGLGAQAIAPPLTRLLLRIIPGHSASVFFSDETGELMNIYDENPALIEVGPIYVNEFHNRRETDVWIGFKETFQRGLVGVMVEELIRVDRRTWKRSDMYNQVFRPLGCDGGLRLALRHGGRPLGGIAVSRSEGEREFAKDDLDLLVSLEPYFSHAFKPPSAAPPLAESDADEDQGLIIADRDGRIRHLSQQARVLLFYATNEDVAPGKLHAGKQELPPRIAQLARSLVEVFEGDAPATPPTYCQRNNWGEFVFRAYWLNGQGARSPLIAIRINRREPLPVRLLRRMERLPLSGRQMEVSLHLASGKTYKEIAERLGVSRPTVIYHAQEVFNKLGVASRAELQAKLMTL